MRRNNVLIFTLAVFVMSGLCGMLVTQEAGATNYPWLSWRHDIHNTGAAPDAGYPTTVKLLWDKTRTLEANTSQPGRCTTPVVVGGNIVITTGNGGVLEARDQVTGNLIWSKVYTWLPQPPIPPDTPPNWCQGDIPTISGNLGRCGYTIDGKCPDWCYECTATPLDCTNKSKLLIRGLSFDEQTGIFVAGATIDLNPARVYFGTMDGRMIALNLADGSAVWQKEPWKEPGGPNTGRPWYDQKFAWHLSPPSVDNGKLYFGSFLPSFFWIFQGFPLILDADGNIVGGWPSFNTNYKQYWVGRDGWTYCADKNTGSILWGWDPGGCGVTNIPPVAGGKVFFNADTVVDYHYGQMAACDVNTGEKLWHVGPVPSAQGGNPAISISRNTIFWPEGDGAVWAVDLTTGHVKWGYHGGFSAMGATGVASSMAIDEQRGWVLGASDTGHLFVLDMDTGRLIKETYLGVPGWKSADGWPDAGYWFPGASAMAIVPSQGIFYISGTDFDKAWQGQFSLGKEKLFCYDYASGGDTLNLLWDYQFYGANGNEYIVKGHDPYQIAFYTLGSPALADGHVYYGSYNGHIYCFGDSYAPPTTTTTSILTTTTTSILTTTTTSILTTTTTSIPTTTTTSIPTTTTTSMQPTLITIAFFNAEPGNKNVKLVWKTESEIDNAGFNLYRSEYPTGGYIKINNSIILAKGAPSQGAVYTVVDGNVQNGKTYYYKLEDIDNSGKSTLRGPVQAKPKMIYGIFNREKNM